jgi:hypothetical protein
VSLPPREPLEALRERCDVALKLYDGNWRRRWALMELWVSGARTSDSILEECKRNMDRVPGLAIERTRSLRMRLIRELDRKASPKRNKR